MGLLRAVVVPAFLGFAVAGCGWILETSQAPLADGGMPDADLGDADPGDGGLGDGGADACAPAVEACGDGADDDCDGMIDEDCTCNRYVLLGHMGEGLTPDDPIGRIADAILSMAKLGEMGLVCVGAADDGGGVCEAKYEEAVVMHEGISVRGRYRADPARWVTDRNCRTSIEAVTAVGVHFPEGITSATSLSGFEVASIVTSSDDPALPAAVTMLSGGEVSDCSIQGRGGATSFGIVVGAGSRPGEEAPRIFGNPRISGALDAAGQAVGVAVSRRSVELRTNDFIEGGVAGDTSVGVALSDAGGSSVTGNLLIRGSPGAGTTRESFGVYVIGRSDGIVIEDNTIRGGAAEQSAVGVYAGLDPLGGLCIGEVRIENNPGLAGGDANTVAGAHITGCTVRVDGNALLIGAEAAGSVMRGFGVLCQGLLARCLIDDNVAIHGMRAAEPGASVRAVAFIEGSSGHVAGTGNVVACESGGDECVGIDVVLSGLVVVDRNIIAPGTGLRRSGIRIDISDATVTNNLVTTDRVGIHMIVGVLAGSVAEVVVHSNTVLGRGAPGPSRSALFLFSDPTGVDALRRGVVRNNIAVCLSDPAERYSVVRLGTGMPRLVQNNDLFGCQAAYAWEEGAIDDGTVADLEAIDPMYTGNLEVAPGFAAVGDHHLARGSPLVNAGTGADTGGRTGPPDLDLDEELRAPAAPPDIGCDEFIGP